MPGSESLFSGVWLTPIAYLFDPTQRIYIPYLCTSFLVAIAVTMLEERREREEARRAQSGTSPREPRKTVLQRLLPKSVFLHRSAIVDYFYFYSNTLLYAVISAPSIFTFSGFAQNTYRLLETSFGAHAQTGRASFLISLLYSIAVILAMDLALFLAHWIQHRIPFLWSFHKVHHSAEVLTPITVYRMHPIDDMLSFLFTGMFAGVVDGLFRYFVVWNIPQILVFRLNFILFLFYVASYHLRHSEIWLSYGPRWSRVFISPAQHQIHHSTAKKHWDKNFGFIFAFWDGLFGSLYVPKQREKIRFGIGDGTDGEFSSVWRLYWIPFRDCFRMFRQKAPTAQSRPEEPAAAAVPPTANPSDPSDAADVRE